LRSIGRPLPDVEVRIVSDEGAELGTDEVGEIHVRTPRAMKGGAGAKDAPFTADGWLPTRDLGWVDADGYLYVAGRKDDMIIRGGENVAPAEVEAVLGAHPAVDEVAVVGLPDVEWGQRIGAFVVLRPGASATADELSEFCRARLASFKKPEVIRFLPELPKNPMGKVLRRELRAEVGAGGADGPRGAGARRPGGGRRRRGRRLAHARAQHARPPPPRRLDRRLRGRRARRPRAGRGHRRGGSGLLRRP